MSNIFVAIKLALVAMQARLNLRFGIDSQKGVTLIEYALIGVLISVVAIVMLGNIGVNVNATFSNINSKFGTVLK